jgi:hypothetical protein
MGLDVYEEGSAEPLRLQCEAERNGGHQKKPVFKRVFFDGI